MRPRPLVGVVAAGLAIAGGCGAEPQPVPASVSGTTVSSPTPDPVKYASDTFKSCPEIRQELPDLPPPLAAEPLEGADRYSLTCTFTTSRNDEPMISFQVELYGNQQDASGAERARSGFSGTPTGAEKDTSVDLGSEARWADPGVGASCRLEFLDGNAVMITSYNSGAKGFDPRSEECRRGARDIAKRIYETVRPQ